MNKPAAEFRYLFGPVPSRRLGLSLGVDIVPFKTCTQNCIYCQLGCDGKLTLDRKEYVPIDSVVDELKRWLEKGLPADYITISGSGEPTLNTGLGDLIDGIRKISKLPVAVITNGTLFSMPEVRRDCAKADVVLPSLDAGDPETFQKINRHHPELDFDSFLEGLRQFRRDYKGQIWLEIFLCLGINTSPESIENIRRAAGGIDPDRIQLNTAVRPTAHPDVVAVPEEQMKVLAKQIHPNAEVIADYPSENFAKEKNAEASAILETLKRRPCTLEDLCASLQISPLSANKQLKKLQNAGLIRIEIKGGKLFYAAQ